MAETGADVQKTVPAINHQTAAEEITAEDGKTAKVPRSRGESFAPFKVRHRRVQTTRKRVVRAFRVNTGLGRFLILTTSGLSGFNVDMFAPCPICKQETLFTVDAVYDGFKKVGESRTCSVCGYVMKGDRPEAAPKKDPLADLFGDDAKPERIELFDVEKETGKMCRKCMHYVIHPFTQRCGVHDIEVQATDSCEQFEKK